MNLYSNPHIQFNTHITIPSNNTRVPSIGMSFSPTTPDLFFRHVQLPRAFAPISPHQCRYICTPNLPTNIAPY